MDEAMVRKRCAEILSDAPVTGDDMILYRAAYADGLEAAASYIASLDQKVLKDLDTARQDAARLRGILQAILNADERGQGLPFQEAMQEAQRALKGA